MARNLYEFCSVLLPDSIYFGGFPDDDMIRQMIDGGFTHIVNLTMAQEMDGIQYDPGTMQAARFPIRDHGIPDDPLDYCCFVTHLSRLWSTTPNLKLYIHCRGGHGRSSVLCVSLMLSLGKSLTLHEAIHRVNEAHRQRVLLREKWRARHLPFNHQQHSFLHRMHKTIFLNTQQFLECAPAPGPYNWVLPRGTGSASVPVPVPVELIFETSDEKENEITNLLETRFRQQRDLRCRLQLTFLKPFVFVGVDSELDRMVRETLWRIRELLFLNES